MKKIPDNAKKVFKGEFFSVWQWDQVLYDGSTKIFEYVERPDVCTVIPVTSDGKVVLLEEEQPTEERRFTFPSGCVEEDEPKESCASRELTEETGYVSSHIEHWFSRPAGLRNVCEFHIFIAKKCALSGPQKLDPGEKITVHLLSFEELLARADDIAEKNHFIYPYLIKAKYSEEEKQKLKDLLGITT
jgi:ADP-ribose pyrophosphatase